MKRRNLVNAALPASAGRFIYGIHAIEGWIGVRPGHMRVLQYDSRGSVRSAAIVKQAAAAGVRVQSSGERELTGLAGTTRHQGIVAQCEPFPYADFSEIVAAQARLLVVVDQLQDPHNLGALLRSAEAVGAGAVILPFDGCVGVTATVEAAAAGACALIPISRVTNVGRSLEALKEHGYWTVGLVPQGGADLFAFDAPEKIALVLGGETGMRPLVRRICDFTVSIPMAGRVESLNASVAVGVALYELKRRWSGMPDR